jgi:hypothetical protein
MDRRRRGSASPAPPRGSGHSAKPGQKRMSGGPSSSSASLTSPSREKSFSREDSPASNYWGSSHLNGDGDAAERPGSKKNSKAKDTDDPGVSLLFHCWSPGLLRPQVVGSELW